jgi:lysophospholipase L1-like esterase
MSEINNYDPNNYDPNPYDDVTIDEALTQIYDRVNDRTIRQIVTILKKVIDGISTGKQDAIDSSHKLSADFIDDTNATNKFATEEELEQIETNKNNILLLEKQSDNIYTTQTVVDLTDVSKGYIKNNGDFNTSGSSNHIYSMPVGNIKEIQIQCASGLSTAYAFACIKDGNGDVVQIMQSDNTTNPRVFPISPTVQPTDTLYITQYYVSQPTTYYNTFNYRTYSKISDNYESEIAEIAEKVDSLRYGDVISKPYDFSGKKMQFFGDSITYGYIRNSESPATNNYPYVFSTAVGAASYTNNGVNGATLSEVQGKTCIYDTIQANLDTTADVIFIAGGVNDWVLGVDKSTLTTAVTNICSYLKANYTGRVIFITPINTGGYYSSTPAAQSLQSVRNVITEIAIENGYDVVQGYKFPFPTQYNDSTYISAIYQDLIHPTEIGYAMYAKALQTAVC